MNKSSERRTPDREDELEDIETHTDRLDFDLKSIISDDLRNQLSMMLDRIENINSDNEHLREDCNVLEFELDRQRNMYENQLEIYNQKTKEFKSSSSQLHDIEQKN